eukprot:1848892-Rhodomonas_salina.1
MYRDCRGGFLRLISGCMVQVDAQWSPPCLETRRRDTVCNATHPARKQTHQHTYRENHWHRDVHGTKRSEKSDVHWQGVCTCTRLVTPQPDARACERKQTQKHRPRTGPASSSDFRETVSNTDFSETVFTVSTRGASNSRGFASPARQRLRAPGSRASRARARSAARYRHRAALRAGAGAGRRWRRRWTRKRRCSARARGEEGRRRRTGRSVRRGAGRRGTLAAGRGQRRSSSPSRPGTAAAGR